MTTPLLIMKTGQTLTSLRAGGEDFDVAIMEQPAPEGLDHLHVVHLLQRRIDHVFVDDNQKMDGVISISGLFLIYSPESG